MRSRKFPTHDAPAGHEGAFEAASGIFVALVVLGITGIAAWSGDWFKRAEGWAVDEPSLADFVASDEAWRVDNAIATGAPIDARGANGYTPLIWAAQSGDLALVTRLIDAGADPSTATERGVTALAMAANQGHLSVVSALVAAGAAVDQPAMGGTALHIALWASQDEVAAWLISHRANVNTRDANGLTPLMVLVYRDDPLAPAMARRLVASGADARATTRDGKTAADLARAEGRDDLLPALVPAE